MRILVLTLVLSLFPAEAWSAQAIGHSRDLARFHGVWIGSNVLAEKRQRGPIVTEHDAGLAIQETKTGFHMTWKPLSEERARRIRARFVATNKPDVFAVDSVDPPLTSREKLWAQLEGDRLVVYLSSFGDDGGERVIRFELSVSDGRMIFRHTLSQGGLLLERVKGVLSRAKVVL